MLALTASARWSSAPAPSARVTFAHCPGEEDEEARVCAFYGGGGGESEAHLAAKERYVGDVAILGPDGTTPRVILEVRATHATTRARPEPWFELDARLVLEELANAQGKTSIGLECERPTSPRKCPNCALIGGAVDPQHPPAGLSRGLRGRLGAGCAMCPLRHFSIQSSVGGRSARHMQAVPARPQGQAAL
jgi:hypothetical protein